MHSRPVIAAVGCFAAVVMTACSASTQGTPTTEASPAAIAVTQVTAGSATGGSQTSASEGGATHSVGGTVQTCSSLLGKPDDPTCHPNYEDAFTRWGGNLNSYLNSERVDQSFALTDRVLLGLDACLMHEKGRRTAEYLSAEKKFYPNENEAQMLTFWFAGEILCPEQNFGNVSEGGFTVE